MIVSFDLDDTLFINPAAVEAEKPLIFPFRLFFRERLRLGTIELLLKIKKSGIKLWIYTTSYRSEKYIKTLFKCYGIKIDQVINGERHQKEVQKDNMEVLPSKYPPKYRINLHVDDDTSVAQNGIRYGFKVYLLGNNDANWDMVLWDEINKIKEKLIPNP